MYIHNIDPIAFELFGIAMPWYWLAYLVGLFWVIIHGHLLCSKHQNTIGLDTFYLHLQWGWPALFIGARVFYILFYNFNFFYENPMYIPQIWYGGMSFHGALLAITLSSWIISKRSKTSFLGFTDILVTAAPLGLFFGRVANFINGELAGRPTDLPWAVVFPQFYDELPRHPSQLYQAATEGLLLFLILSLTFKKMQTTNGYQTSLFLFSYGAMRFITEFFREPDPQLGTFFGITMGQILCLLMITGAVALFLNLKKTAPQAWG